jgi:pyrroline-5-carboxylate reductase
MNNTILIVGAGNMGSALVNGLSASANNDLKIIVLDKDPERAKGLVLNKECVEDSIDDFSKFTAIVFCVKPQDFAAAANNIKSTITKESVVMSLMAGIEIGDIKRELDFKGQVIRSMPNILARVDEAATAMAACKSCSESSKELAMTVFASVGEAVWVKESQLDAVTGLSGSGPAYVYMIIEALVDGGVKMGIPRITAHKLAVQTVLGAAKMVKESDLHPAILKDQVTTPGGTTIHAIHELEERGLRAMLISAVETATEQSRNLITRK